MVKRTKIKRFEERDQDKRGDKDIDERTDEIYRELEEFLTSHGSRKVKKRVFETSPRKSIFKKSFSNPQKYNSKKTYSEIDELVEELERALYGEKKKSKRVMEDQQYKERLKERF